MQLYNAACLSMCIICRLNHSDIMYWHTHDSIPYKLVSKLCIYIVRETKMKVAINVLIETGCMSTEVLQFLKSGIFDKLRAYFRFHYMKHVD